MLNHFRQKTDHNSSDRLGRRHPVTYPESDHLLDVLLPRNAVCPKMFDSVVPFLRLLQHLQVVSFTLLSASTLSPISRSICHLSQCFTVRNLYENAAFSHIFSNVNHCLAIFSDVKPKILKNYLRQEPLSVNLGGLSCM